MAHVPRVQAKTSPSRCFFGGNYFSLPPKELVLAKPCWSTHTATGPAKSCQAPSGPALASCRHRKVRWTGKWESRATASMNDILIYLCPSRLERRGYILSEIYSNRLSKSGGTSDTSLLDGYMDSVCTIILCCSTQLVVTISKQLRLGFKGHLQVSKKMFLTRQTVIPDEAELEIIAGELIWTHSL